MNSIRVQYILDQTSKPVDIHAGQNTHVPLQNLKALDVGCGGGLLSESLARLGANVTAVDPSAELVQKAKQHAMLDPKTQTIDYRGGCTVEDLARERTSADKYDNDLYDVICLLEVIEHVTDVPAILNAARSLLKPDTGRLFVSTMNRTAKSKLIAIIGAEYVMRYLPPGTHDWNQFRSPAEVQDLATNAGLNLVDVQGMVITSPPFGGKWSWKLDPHDVDVNWIGTYRAKA
jgi:2-polyprenyl-6-hydroxyphenyl methylase/3-demethylubiquinone-9 3-methyltransferase